MGKLGIKVFRCIHRRRRVICNLKTDVPTLVVGRWKRNTRVCDQFVLPAFSELGIARKWHLAHVGTMIN